MTAEKAFYDFADELLNRLLELNPVAATQFGDHRWDDRLADHRLAALEGQNEEIRDSLEALQAMETDVFGLDAQIDHTLMIQILKSFVRDFEKTEGHLRSPGLYLSEVMNGILTLILRDFAPLPDRVRSMVARTKQAGDVLAAGMTNIIPERVPKVWAEVTLEQAQQAPGLFMGLLPAIAAQASPQLQEEMIDAGQAAVQSIQEYITFLENDVIANAEGEFAAGKELFDEMLREDHMVDYDADELLETGREQFHLTKELMEEVAQQIDPDRTVQEILEDAKSDHPTAEGLLETYEAAMDTARQYVVDHEIATIPDNETLQIVETPVYLRPIIPYAAYMPPGFLEEEQEGIFFVTPVDPDAPPEIQEEKLKGHFNVKLPVTALHEAYPGHHLQLVWSNRQETIPRRMGSFLATLFIEGWAFYCEELMEQLGYIDQPIQRLGRLSDQLWRAGRIILDVSLHTKGMSVDEAIDFLVEECQLEPSNAQAEVRRYTSTPTQPQSYLMGKLAILDLVEDYRAAHPDASMREIHDAILGCGSLPPRLMRRRLLG